VNEQRSVNTEIKEIAIEIRDLERKRKMNEREEVRVKEIVPIGEREGRKTKVGARRRTLACEAL